MSKGSEKKLAHRRLQMLEFAETLGNVSEACRNMGRCPIETVSSFTSKLSA